ncbi:quinoprotein relay system zinc metallohydrolase 2 [Massilia sp. IC2-278]|uniref:quinoprotein relay system zinc metallohydrolase 2 n=1 Tax=Massilia sp. IC2-278 TaxID=2887200 RepID=UPI001E331A1F|nr:quinoprotein relay system zinc metallohydrolase 2 [Massilia sp. IC2-278]MCC2961599.1 quinoprotein relay system zinc metallohydrolase 2 [Massilia sp. IC2-278]
MRRLIHVVWLLAAAQLAVAAPLRIDQIAPGVYVHIGQHKDFEEGYDGDIANIGFVVGSDAVAVIDTGGSYAVGMALKQALRAVTQLPIRYVINTHGHPDHVFGNAAFTEADPTAGEGQPRLVGHATLPRFLALRGDAYVRNLKQQLGTGAGASRLVAPGETVQDRLTLDLGGRKLELRAWPKAHTDNDLSVFDAASGTLWTGDLLFIERTPAIDGDLQGWLAAMDALDKMPAGLTIPGHGPVTRDRKAALARQRHYLATLLHDVRAGIRQGADMPTTMATAAASERSRWQLFDIVNRRNVNLLYPILEWE